MHKVGGDIEEKEKIVGGIFTLEHLAWMIGGVFFGVVVGVILHFFIGWFCLIIAVPSIAACYPFAFIKKYDMSFFKYLIEKNKFKKCEKRYPNQRSGLTLTFSTDEYLSK